MSEKPIDWQGSQMAAQFEQIQALVLASIQTARDYRDQLQQQLQREADGPVAQRIRQRIQKIHDWEIRAEHLRAWLFDQSHEIGVKLEQMQMGDLDAADADIRRTRQWLQQKHRRIALAIVEVVGRDRYQAALELAEDLLSREEALEETEEFRELRDDLDTVDDILEGDPPAELTETTTETDTEVNDDTEALIQDAESAS